MSEEFTVKEAAAFLSLTTEGVRKAVREGRLEALPDTDPARLARSAVEEYHHLRQGALVASLARSGETPVSVARRVRRKLHSSTETGLPRSHASRLAAMPETWRSLFSRAELAAACVEDGGGCRWCKAAEYSAFLGTRPPEFAEAYVALFGGQPCGVCGPGLRRPLMAALAKRVHPGRQRPPDARAEAAAAVPPVPRPRPAQPRVGDDNGKALVASALRTARGRLKDAKRSGDQRYALQLAQTIRALEADAAVVDGLVAAARPGRLRCGHLLGANCACPRRASTRGAR